MKWAVFSESFLSLASPPNPMLSYLTTAVKGQRSEACPNIDPQRLDGGILSARRYSAGRFCAFGRGSPRRSVHGGLSIQEAFMKNYARFLVVLLLLTSP